MKTLIGIRGLNMIFITVRGERIHALSDINVEVGEGEFVTVVGPSGCGKTTLLRILGGLLRRTSGQVTLAGAPVDGPRRDIGIVFQNAILLPWRTVLENAMLPAEVLGLSKEKYKTRALELLKMVGL